MPRAIPGLASRMCFRPNDLSVLRHEEYDWVTLITCQGYDERQDAYRGSMVVRAVLVEVTQP